MVYRTVLLEYGTLMELGKIVIRLPVDLVLFFFGPFWFFWVPFFLSIFLTLSFPFDVVICIPDLPFLHRIP